MAVANPPRPAAASHEAASRTTAPMRLYAADQQPIRLLAELLGVSAAELVHRAVVEYFAKHHEVVARTARTAQAAFEAGDFTQLSAALESNAQARRQRRAERLAELSRPRSEG